MDRAIDNSGSVRPSVRHTRYPRWIFKISRVL